LSALLALTRQKPGYPFQVLGFAYANPVGFPLLSLAHQLRTNSRNCLPAIAGQIIAFGNYLRVIRRSQFCSDKIAWFATKHVAQRNARFYPQPAAATTLSARGYAYSSEVKNLKNKNFFYFFDLAVNSDFIYICARPENFCGIVYGFMLKYFTKF
jgi:hypothetical protein